MAPEPTVTGRRVYKNPPILEAICELHFADADWSYEALADMHRRVKEAYPAVPQQQPTAVQLVPTTQGLVAGSPPKSERTPRVRFSTDDGDRIVTVGDGVLSVHVANGYPGWEKFYELIEAALDQYCAVARPGGVSRIGMRYLNSITVPPFPFDLAEYFWIGPTAVRGTGLQVDNFFTRAEFAEPTASIRLIRTFGTVLSEAESRSVLLDLDAIWEDAGSPWPTADLGSLMAQVNSLRDLERRTFEASIKDSLREIFDAD